MPTKIIYKERPHITYIELYVPLEKAKSKKEKNKVSSHKHSDKKINNFVPIGLYLKLNGTPLFLHLTLLNSYSFQKAYSKKPFPSIIHFSDLFLASTDILIHMLYPLVRSCSYLLIITCIQLIFSSGF